MCRHGQRHHFCMGQLHGTKWQAHRGFWALWASNLAVEKLLRYELPPGRAGALMLSGPHSPWTMEGPHSALNIACQYRHYIPRAFGGMGWAMGRRHGCTTTASPPPPTVAWVGPSPGCAVTEGQGDHEIKESSLGPSDMGSWAQAHTHTLATCQTLHSQAWPGTDGQAPTCATPRPAHSMPGSTAFGAAAHFKPHAWPLMGHLWDSCLWGLQADPLLADFLLGPCAFHHGGGGDKAACTGRKNSTGKLAASMDYGLYSDAPRQALPNLFRRKDTSTRHLHYARLTGAYLAAARYAYLYNLAREAALEGFGQTSLNARAQGTRQQHTLHLATLSRV